MTTLTSPTPLASAAAVLAVATACLLGGCDCVGPPTPRIESVPDPHRYRVESFPALTAPDFRLRVEVGIGELLASKVGVLNASGEMVHIWPDLDENHSVEWRENTRTLSERERAEVRDLLVRWRFVELPAEYREPLEPDLGPITVSLRAGGAEKTVRAFGRAPRDLVANLDSLWNLLQRPEQPPGTVVSEERARELGAVWYPR